MKKIYFYLSIFFVFLSVCILLCCIKYKYGSVYEYFDIYSHPYKYSYNYFLSKSLWQMEEIDTLSGKPTLTSEFREIDKKHRNQNNIKSKTIIKIIDKYYDMQRILLTDDYKNLKILSIEEQDFLILGETSTYIINYVNMLYPQIESTNNLKKELAKRTNIRKIIKNKYNTNIIKISFADLNKEDSFFVDFIDNDRKVDDHTSKKIEEIYKKSNKKDLLSGQAGVEAGKLFFSFVNEEYGNQYIATDKNENIFKIRKAKGGNVEYWEIIKMTNADIIFDHAIKKSEERINQLKNKIDNINF